MAETIVCRDCAIEKPVEQFNFRNKKKGIRVYQCKSCQAAYHRQHYLRNKEKYKKKARRWDAENRDRERKERQVYVIEYLLEHPCVDCGETNPLILDFDHVRGEKKHNISAMVAGVYGWKSLKAELAKCDVRCVNCHRIRTANEENWAILALIREHNL
jgi:hypothetical protein